MTTPTLTLPAPERRTPSIAAPLILIGLGVAFLLANIGALRGLTWAEVFRLWPLLLVIGGVDLLLRPRSFVAALVVEVAIIAAAFIYLISGATITTAALSYSVDVPRAAATNLELTVNYGAGTLSLAGGATSLVSVRSSQEDVTRTVDQGGASASVVLSSRDQVFWGQSDRNWDVTLPNDVRTGMTLNLGAGDFDVDLSQLKVTRATINAGASDLTVTLPKPTGNVPITISSGASSVTIIVPSGVAYAVTTKGVMHSVTGPAQSSDYMSATDRVTIDVSIAAGSVAIR